MAFGTETVPKVSKIFGPGNQFVTCAKQQVSMTDVAIDMPAGPSEVAIIADETCHPNYVAADMLSQAEHGMDSQSILFTNSEKVAKEVLEEVEKQLAALPRKNMAQASLEHSRIIVLRAPHTGNGRCNGMGRQGGKCRKRLPGSLQLRERR